MEFLQVSVNPNSLDENVKFRIFQLTYRRLHPVQNQPTDSIIKECGKHSNITIYLSSLNMIIAQDKGDVIEFVYHWCCASKELDKSHNMKAFFEVLRLVKSLGKPVIIANLQDEYYKATEPYIDNYRRFK